MSESPTGNDANSVIAVIDKNLLQALPETIIDVSKSREVKCIQADEDLEVWVFLDLLEQVFVRETEGSLDDQGTQCRAKGRCWRSKSLAELNRVITSRSSLVMSSASLIQRVSP